MEHYFIAFTLLLPRPKILRLDILPFAILYLILGYYFYVYYDDPDISLYLKLTIIAICFIQCIAEMM
jgi:hypothetical protein